MTPEDLSDDVPMTAADILKAFKGLSSTHGIPHVSDAHGKTLCYHCWQRLNLMAVKSFKVNY